MRIRQVVLATRDLEPTIDTLGAVLGSEICFRDPGVAEFGLVNALLRIGDTFLEVVSPVEASAPAKRFLDRKGGDAGYMLILQSDDLDADEKRVREKDVRVVWKVDLPDIRTRHLHPADTGGTLLSLDQAVPPASWRWAGPTWQKAKRSDAKIIGVDLAALEPDALARRWSELLARPVRKANGGFEMPLDGSTVRFVAAKEPRAEGLAAFDVDAKDRKRALAAARDRGVADGDAITIAGTRIRFA